ncbi:putative polyketide synthase [Aspergillus karnatakaensis]|uniref:putative polyketide synthase n=1 Tax=Aspergillus karnatakaensis TaxID=1810916 RepID=UPI003CCDC3A4
MSSTTQKDGVSAAVDYLQSHAARNTSSSPETSSSSPSCECNTPTSSTTSINDNTLSHGVYKPIAIVGMAMRLPGGVRTEKAFWDMLAEKRDGLCRVPESRYNVDSFYSDSKRHSVRTTKGYFLQEDPAEFDAPFFGISNFEASRLDPQQRLLLEVVWECMESAGQQHWQGSDIGCYVGVFGEDWLDISSKDTQQIDRFHVLGTGNFALSNRISYEYDLTGPSMTFQTGCSSSLVGFHEACQAIQTGDCSSAIVAGSNLILSPTMTTTMSDNMVLAPDGVCKTFDAAANGYGRGEAINAVYLKPLDQALADGDPIRAVIRSTATNCDGRTPGITTPGSKTQKQLIRHAYKRAGIEDITETAFFECHGTGTTIGDLAETSVVADLFQARGVFIGAVKPNVGHSEGASGLTSIIKAVLSLEKNMILPNAHFHKPNPQIPFETAKLVVPVDLQPWPVNKERRVSVNCFGIGGANAHVILDSATLHCPPSSPVHGSQQNISANLLLVSASSATSLEKRMAETETYVTENPDRVNDLAYTLALRRRHLPYKGVLVLKSDGNTPTTRVVNRPASSPSVTFVFNGQGAQWAGMGKELFHSLPVFKEGIRQMDRVLQGLKPGPDWLIEDELLKDDSASRIDNAEISQTLCTAIQIGLVNILTSWDVHPTSVVGHSSGEICAAYAAKAISLDTAIITAYYRGQVAKGSKGGAMAAVGLGSKELQPFLRKGVVVACHNSPQSSTVSGEVDAVETLIQEIQYSLPDVFCRRLRVDTAYHSDHVRTLGDQYEKAISPYMRVSEYMTPLYSTVYGKVIEDPTLLNASYWRHNLESPVLFSDAMRSLVCARPNQLVIEIGPHSALAGPIRQIMHSEDNKSHAYVPTLVRNQDQAECILTTLGHLWTLGIPVQIDSVIQRGKVLTDLPSYPWSHGARFWEESRLSQTWRLRKFPHHELLGSRVLGSSDREPVWRNLLELEKTPWLAEHVLLKNIVFPGAGYIAVVGEAIYQQTGTENYTIRNLLLKTPLFLLDGHSVELITSLKPLRLTDLQDSDWYEFTITAFDGKEWTKHCQGEARACPDKRVSSQVLQPAIRKIQSEPWYRLLAGKGLAYGPRFRGLEDIMTNPNTNLATGKVHDDLTLHESHYAMHPIAIDQCLQLMSVAAYSARGYEGKRLAIPSHFQDIYVGKSEGPLSVKATVQKTSSSIYSANIMALVAGFVGFSLSGGSCFVLDEQAGTSDAQVPLLSRLNWKPDIDFIPSEQLLPYHAAGRNLQCMKDLAAVCIVESALQAQNIQPANDSLGRYQDWLLRNLNEIQQGTHGLSNEGKKQICLTTKERFAFFDNTVKVEGAKAEWQGRASLGALARAVMQHTTPMIEGTKSPLEVLMDNNALEEFYSVYCDYTPWKTVLSNLTHANPRMRILEIGAGTGAATAAALNFLQTPEGIATFESYLFTDLSPAFFDPAKEKLKHYGRLDYAVLDISKEPSTQGFEHGTFDLIIAANVLHATPSISATLRHVRQLLTTGGRLLLLELDPAIPAIDYMMGCLPGWWIGKDDGRVEKPYISTARWELELRQAGFSGIDALCFDDPEDARFNAHMLSTNPAPPCEKQEVTLVYQHTIPDWASELSRQLETSGHTLRWAEFESTPSTATSVIFLLDLETPFLKEMSQNDFHHLKRHFEAYQSIPVIWITQSTQTQCKDPWFGLALGIARALRKELAIQLATIELDQLNLTTATVVARVFEKLVSQVQAMEYPDMEYVIHDGNVLTGRFKWESLFSGSPRLSDNTPRKLLVKTCGILDSMEWVPVDVALPKSDEVLVDVKYSALNFKDIMVSMGLFGFVNDLGMESTGVVRQVGREVTTLEAGDHVLITAPGSMQTQVCLAESWCVKIPDWLSLEDAASMGVAFSTVLYSLVHLGRLEEGQSVLIHSAAGGVGQAAIQVCQMKKAEIFVTVGNIGKSQYLQDTYNISPDHIFNSRDDSFLSDLMQATNGKGVDVVLNSLAGELLHASWKCVAAGGKMFELGKRDFLGHGMLSMDAFMANRAFFGVDLDAFTKCRPSRLLELARDYFKLLESGQIRPIRPIKLFNAADALEAFRYMQKGVHMGKIILKMPESSSCLPNETSRRPIRFRSDASYLLIGGLGGIGQAVSRWMVEQGAKQFIFLSRSAGQSHEHQEFLHELEALGCNTTTVAGSVSNAADVQRAISSSHAPVHGVINLSMVLKDQRYFEMTHEEWRVPFESKVHGTWTLHSALEHSPLDFFVVVSSLCSVAGNAGQTNYASANAFLDAFVQYRRDRGLPASVLNLGVVDEVGTVAGDTQLLQQLRALGNRLISEAELLDALQALLTELPSQPPLQSVLPEKTSCVFAVGMSSTKPLRDSNGVALWRGPDARFAGYENWETQTGEEPQSENYDSLRAFIGEVEADPQILNAPETLPRVTREVGKLITSYVSADQEMSDEQIANYAIDSLMSIEIRNWVRRKMMIDVSLPEISRAGTVAGFALLTVDKLKAKFLPGENEGQEGKQKQ